MDNFQRRSLSVITNFYCVKHEKTAQLSEKEQHELKQLLAHDLIDKSKSKRSFLSNSMTILDQVLNVLKTKHRSTSFYQGSSSEEKFTFDNSTTVKTVRRSITFPKKIVISPVDLSIEFQLSTAVTCTVWVALPFQIGLSLRQTFYPKTR